MNKKNVDYEKFCNRYVNRSFDFHRGMICSLTNQKPNFTDDCVDFVLNEKREGQLSRLESERSKRWKKIESYKDDFVTGDIKRGIRRFLNLTVVLIFAQILNYLGLPKEYQLKTSFVIFIIGIFLFSIFFRKSGSNN